MKTDKIYAKTLVGKRVARIMAIQAVYAVSFEEVDNEIDDVIYNLMRFDAIDILGSNLNAIDEALLIKLARGATKEKEVLQESLTEFLAENWRFERLPKLVQALLLVGAYELKFIKDATESTIINEYLEIAKSFNHEGEVGFINKVLDGFNKKFLSF